MRSSVFFIAAALCLGAASSAAAQQNRGADAAFRFNAMDTNGDGQITRQEWRGSRALFDALDANGDGVLTRAEALGRQVDARDEFRSMDANDDGQITRDEWPWNMSAFNRLDVNRDGHLSRGEFESEQGAVGTQGAPQRENATYRAGYERGRTEGIQAGREDKPHGWDLEGQRELETADSGYEPRMGERTDYQAGYRAGFRRGYREGFGPR